MVYSADNTNTNKTWIRIPSFRIELKFALRIHLMSVISVFPWGWWRISKFKYVPLHINGTIWSDTQKMWYFIPYTPFSSAVHGMWTLMSVCSNNHWLVVAHSNTTLVTSLEVECTNHLLYNLQIIVLVHLLKDHAFLQPC